MTEISSPLPASVAGVETDDFAFHIHQPSSPHSLQHQPFSSPPAPPLEVPTYNYNFSSNVYEELSASASNTDQEDDEATDEDTDDHTLLRANGAGKTATSTRSSISSFPDSIIPDAPAQASLIEPDLDTPIKSTNQRILHIGRSGSLGYKIKTPGSGNNVRDRNHGSGFRHPSSVRAMQMRDEPFDEAEDLIRTYSGSGHSRRGSRMSIYSHRSSGSTQTSPTKRKSPLKSSRGSNLKTEFPLVLLHCTLLPPTLGAWSLQAQPHLNDEAFLRDLLPDLYWRRWKLLQEKVSRNVEVRSRGVLIPHPRNEYELLEERLLESLELERPRVREGHYWRPETAPGLSELERDSGIESASQTDDDGEGEADTKSKCPDCGKKVSADLEWDRKWEVKVYAANGLMRSGAWTAAWSEMEKVDIEVGVWMPEGVRREIEERLVEMGFGMEGEDEVVDEEQELDEEEHRRREIYGSSELDGAEETQEKTDGLFDEHQPDYHSADEPVFHPPYQQQLHVELQDLILSYAKHFIHDKRNVFIAFLSILVLFTAMRTPVQNSTDVAATLAAIAGPDVPQIEIVTSTVTSTSIEVSTTTVIEPAPVIVTVTASAEVTEPEKAVEPELEEVVELDSEPEKLIEPKLEEVAEIESEREEVVKPEPEPEITEEAADEESVEEQMPSVAEVLMEMLVGDEMIE